MRRRGHTDRFPLAARAARAVFALTAAGAFVFVASAAAHAQVRTDVVTLANGDRITGEVVRLERGRLEFKTDDAGTLSLEWDKLASLVAARIVEVVTTNGSRFVGTLMPAAARAALAVATPAATVALPMIEVTLITPIGRSFWRKLDGSFDAGFSYTQSSGIAQLNLNTETIYRKPAFQGRVGASITLTREEDDSDRDDRGTLEISYLRYPWARWFLAAASRFESNESLGIRLRSQIGGAAGPRLINNNRGQMAAGAGLVFNDERGVDVPPSRNVEAVFLFEASYYTYDRPKTNLDVRLRYYPSLTESGRHRMQFDGGVKRELWKDFFAALTLYNTFDNRPPNPSSDRNDVGAVLSIGWSY
jgi:hypothetical protein